MNLKDELYLVTGTLERGGIEYALCGGIAVIIHGYPRSTRDIDLLIREEDLERARKALESAGYSLPSGMLPFDVGKRTERRVFRVTKARESDCMTLDLMLVSPFLEDVWKSRQKYLIDGRTLCVVSREGLAKMKRAAGRPQDRADLSQLGLDDRSTEEQP